MLRESDPEVSDIIRAEEKRQQEKLSLIPSENFFSPAVREAVGSVFMHKYSEGNVGQRYYEGNENIDKLEELVFTRARKAFNLPGDWEVNAQALSGSNANLAVYLAVLEPGDTMMAMYLPDGGHLSHGWSYEPKVKPDPEDIVYLGGSRKVHITSRMWRVVQYKTDPETQQLDYGKVEKAAVKYKPKLIITGGTAYPRLIDHNRFRQIADRVGALYMADIAHEAGLVAAGVIPSPIGVADIVTLTTHKTLRSGRGSLVFARQDLMQRINRGVLPGLQGGPHNHNIAGICVGLGEVLRPQFKKYARQVVRNAKALSGSLQKQGFKLVTDGADKHLLLINLSGGAILGKAYAKVLDGAGIVANFNTMPQETRSPVDPSALRVGTPWVTTRGMSEKEMGMIAKWMAEAMKIGSVWSNVDWSELVTEISRSGDLHRIAGEVKLLCRKFPLPMKDWSEA